MAGSVRWAMTGTGPMAAAIVSDFHLAENADLRVVVSRDKARADEAAARFGVAEGSGDLAATLARDDIDALYITTPHPFHAAQAEQALRAGKHVLVEKPMTMSEAQGRVLVDLARAQDRFLMEAMWTAFNPTILEALRLVAAGEIGQVQYLTATFGVPFAFDPDHRLWNRDLGGGTVLDQGVYPLSLAHMLFGPPTSIEARGSMSATGVDDEATVLLRFAGGQRAVCVSSMRAFLSGAATISGTAGRIDIAGPFWAATSFELHGVGRDPAPALTWHRPLEGAGYTPMLRAVGQAILEGRREHPQRSHAEILQVARTMDEVLRQVGNL